MVTDRPIGKARDGTGTSAVQPLGQPAGAGDQAPRPPRSRPRSSRSAVTTSRRPGSSPASSAIVSSPEPGAPTTRIRPAPSQPSAVQPERRQPSATQPESGTLGNGGLGLALEDDRVVGQPASRARQPQPGGTPVTPAPASAVHPVNQPPGRPGPVPPPAVRPRADHVGRVDDDRQRQQRRPAARPSARPSPGCRSSSADLGRPGPRRPRRSPRWPGSAANGAAAAGEHRLVGPAAVVVAEDPVAR